MIELLTPQEMAEADRATIASGTSIDTLMERAGYAVADAVAAETAFGVPIVALAGPGNNGGDAFAAAQVLRERGYKIALVDLAGDGGGDAARRARRRYSGTKVGPDDPRVTDADVVIDGLFGGGLGRPIDGEAAALVEAVNASGARVFAIDLPSGVDGATGEVRGPAIRAYRTVTFQRRKPGHYLLPGRQRVGRLTVADIGIRDRTIAALGCAAFANEPALWRDVRPRLADAGHKYDRGNVLVVSGPMSATGASRLAAMAALRGGAGLVTLASPADALLVNACHLTTVMLVKADGAEGLAEALADGRTDAVAIGPGLPPDEGTRRMAEAALRSGAAVVLDAGAVTAFAGERERLRAAVTGTRAVLTPHAGEFSRVFEGGASKLERVRAAARELGVVVLEKGQDTVIADPTGRAAVNYNAPPSLATAGSGDVLTGLVTAFLAQRVAPFEAAAMGVWLHGEAALRVGVGLIADDLLGGLKDARAAFDTV